MQSIIRRLTVHRPLMILAAGWFYWLWISVRLGSPLMFALAFLGPAGLIASFLGLWSLGFGTPLWLVHLPE
jgi:hypothetical protein